MFVGPQGYPQCSLWRNKECKHNLLTCKKALHLLILRRFSGQKNNGPTVSRCHLANTVSQCVDSCDSRQLRSKFPCRSCSHSGYEDTFFLCCVVSIGRFMTSCVEKVSSGDHTTTEAEWLPLTSLDDEVAFTVLASLYFISVALNSLSHTHTHTHIHH